MNTHWDAFAADLFWFVKNKRVEVGALAAPGAWRASAAIARTFPRLSTLLGAAYTSRVSIDGADFILFSWEGTDSILSWLSPPPSPPSERMFSAHRVLASEFGGITERGGEFEGQWLLNTNDSLTNAEASFDASFIQDYAWAFESMPGGIPITLADYYSISREASGNDTLCHRISGEVIVFATDHSFQHLVPLEGCPEYTLYRIRGVPTFTHWVEAVAGQWWSALQSGTRDES